MPIVKTSAIPIYWTDVSNTSRIVTWLTAHYGKLSTSIKGDQRKNSLFRGQYDLFSTSELLFYDRTNRDIHIAKECSLLTPRSAFRSDWRACAAAGYIAALFARTTPRHGHEPGRFEFFEELLAWAEEFGSKRAFLPWTELRFSAFHGHDVNLANEGDETPRFSAEHGGVIAAAYARQHRIPATPFPREVLHILRAWQKANNPRAAAAVQCTEPQMEKLDLLMEKFMTHHFDLPPHVRRTAAEILRTA